MTNHIQFGSLLLAIGAVISAPVADTSDAVRPQDGPIQLFNGKDLSGLSVWLKDTKAEDPRRVFRVTDGMLHVTGDGLGYAITDKAYRDYHCIVEFKWGEKTHEPRTKKAKDSGLLIHSHGEPGAYNGQWMQSIEVQIIEGGCGDFIMVTTDPASPISLTVEAGRDRDNEVVWQKGGMREVFNSKNRKRVNWSQRDPDWKDEIGFRGQNDVESPAGQWTRMDVFCDGGHIQTFVNGVMVNEAFEVTPKQGQIQIQTELAEIYFRKLELWPLGKGPRPAKAE